MGKRYQKHTTDNFIKVLLSTAKFLKNYLNKVQELVWRRIISEKRQVDFLLQLTFHHSMFYEYHSKKLDLFGSFIYFCIKFRLKPVYL